MRKLHLVFILYLVVVINPLALELTACSHLQKTRITTVTA